MDLASIERCLPGEAAPVGHIELEDGSGSASAFDVDRLISSSACFAIASADALGTLPPPQRSIELDHLLAMCTSHCEIDGEPLPAWAELSGVYPSADGRHLQIHCNFPHHADGVVARLGTAHERSAVGAAIAERDAFELESELIDDGMIAAAVRSLEEWKEHPHALATRGLPLIDVRQIGDADPIASSAGCRVLDCSRVLAGPVAGQMLVAFGADVLRLGAAHLPSVSVGVISTGFGKRNAFADLRSEQGRETTWGLLRDADVWIDAYRPGAFARRGFTPERVADERPGIVIVQLSAFDWSGPWSARRGYDSIVQSTTGIRWAGGKAASGTDRPRGLPIQALDYASGFLAAGAASRLLRHQRQVGGSWLVRLSLLRTRDWLVSMGGPNGYEPAPVPVPERYLHSVESDFGRVTAVRPAVGHFDRPPARLGSSPPRWLARPG